MNRIKKSLLSLTIVLSAFILSSSVLITQSSSGSIEMSPEVKPIIKKSCIGCHETKSKNTKGKTKLDFDKLFGGEYSKGKQIAKLNGIVKSLAKGKMPPEKFLKKHPERAITPEQSKVLSDWAKAQAKLLMGG